jgi:hypothetical protein
MKTDERFAGQGTSSEAAQAVHQAPARSGRQPSAAIKIIVTQAVVITFIVLTLSLVWVITVV